MNMNFYRVVMPVRPKPGHPTYWDIQHGVMFVFLFAESDDDAGPLAYQIVSLLPYEITSQEILTVVGDNEPPQMEQLKLAWQAGRAFGLGLQLIAAPVGSDEWDFSKVVEKYRNQ